MTRYRILPALAIVLTILVSDAAAGPPPERGGFFLGFGFGVGNASWDWAFVDGNESEASGVFNLRIGGALREDIVLGLEAWVWAKRWDVLLDDVSIAELQITFNATALAATYFPGNKGVFLRGGIGFGSAKTELKSSFSGGSTATFDPGTDTGVALVGASGYEWRLTKKFALAPQVEILYLGISGDIIENIFEVDGTLQFNWYW